MSVILSPDATIEKNAARVLEYVSPSQVETFELCPRRWYNDSIRGFREPMDPDGAAQRGVDVAGASDLHYRTGIDVDAIDMLPADREGEQPRKFKHHALLKAILPHLPPRGPTVTTERWVVSDLGPGLPKLRGRYDLFDASIVPRLPDAPPSPLLGDVKCRSDARYTKTPAELADDLQLNSYARPKALELGVDHIALRHAYGITKGKPKGFPVTVVLSVTDLEPRHLRTVESVREMTRWARARPRTADALPPNPAACDKYRPHGCPHRGLCGFDGSPSNRSYATTMSTQTNGTPPESDLMKRLRARTAELTSVRGAGAPPPGAAPAAAAPQAAPVPAPAPAPHGGGSTLADRGGGDRSAGPSHEELVQQALRDIQGGSIKLDDSGQVFTRKGADSGWILRQPTLAEQEAFKLSAQQAKRVEREIEAESVAPAGPAVLAQDAPPRTDPPAAAAQEGEGPPAVEPKKRAPRAKKVDAAQAQLPTASAASAAPQSVADALVELEELRERVRVAEYNAEEQSKYAADAYAKLKAGASAGETIDYDRPRGPIIYVNCIPTKGEHKGAGIMFEEWMQPICDEVAKRKGVIDWRLIQYTAKGDLAAAIREVISTLPPVVLVSKFSPAADVFLESVIPWAAQIIQGV